jgi:hypothetical protein
MNNNDISNRKSTNNNNKYKIENFRFWPAMQTEKCRPSLLIPRQKNCSSHFENEKSKLTQ